MLSITRQPVNPRGVSDDPTACCRAGEKGIVSKGCVTKTMIGMEPDAVDREPVREDARTLALGLVSEPKAWKRTTELGQACAARVNEIERADWR